MAVADDASAAYLNPAGLFDVPAYNAAIGLDVYLSGHFASGAPAAGAHPAVGYFSVTTDSYFNDRVRLGGFFLEPHYEKLRIPGTSAGPSQALSSSLHDIGGSVALRLTDNLAVGAQLTVRRLELTTALGFRAETTAGPSLSVLAGPFRALQLGAKYDFGQQGPADLGLPSNPNTQYTFASPARLSAGLSYGIGPDFVLAAELDWLRSHQLNDVDVILFSTAAPGQRMSTGVEQRAGFEWSHRLNGRAMALLLRGGFARQGTPPAFLYGLPEPSPGVTARAIPSRTIVTAGFGFAARVTRYAVSVAFRGVRPVISAGFTFQGWP